MRRFQGNFGRLALIFSFLFTLIIAASAASTNRKETILSSLDHGGVEPMAPLLLDRTGNLFGTTYSGGAYNDGVIFRISPTGHEKVLHEFAGYQNGDGASPSAGLVADKAGNLYGVTLLGGADNQGTVFKLARDGTETLLHEFTGSSDGAQPWATLIIDTKGNLYGTAGSGGGGICDSGCGVVFKLSPAGKETVLYEFKGGNDGVGPTSSLVKDRDGNLYGTTREGGASDQGTAFKLKPDGTEIVLHSFSGREPDGGDPNGLVIDPGGDLYGTAYYGGANGAGIVYKLAPDGTETVLHAFSDGTDGADPDAPLILDVKGNLYGTTIFGGTPEGGTIYKVTPDGVESILYSFKGGVKDGANPFAPLITDGSGNFYGTTSSGGPYIEGTVFKYAK